MFHQHDLVVIIALSVTGWNTLLKVSLPSGIAPRCVQIDYPCLMRVFQNTGFICGHHFLWFITSDSCANAPCNNSYIAKLIIYVNCVQVVMQTFQCLFCLRNLIEAWLAGVWEESLVMFCYPGIYITCTSGHKFVSSDGSPRWYVWILAWVKWQDLICLGSRAFHR
jgi:hypothetical protein